MKLPWPEHVSRNYPGKSASDSNYVTVRPRLSQLSGYISKFSSGLMALLKFLPWKHAFNPLSFLFCAFHRIDARPTN